EVFTEFAFGYQRVQITMSSRDHSNVDGYRLIAADALDFTLLQHSQQRHLDLGRHVADFVQENGPSIRRFKTPEATLGCAGEGALLVTEKLGGDQRLRDCSAIHPDECPIPAIGSLVDAASYQLLASTGFAENQDRRIGRSQLSDLA